MNALDAQPLPEVLGRLEPELQTILNAARETAADTASDVCLVGGALRDLLLERPGRDLDLVSETSAKTLGTALQKRLGGELTCHDTFLTCTLTFNPAPSNPALFNPALSNLALDLATARSETYARPGALPKVTPGTLKDDLARRDFTVNTFAVNLAEPTTLLSVPGAVNDLEERVLRILHERSFFDDPTRIVRGARLAGRLGFYYGGETQIALTKALAARVYRQVSRSRLKNELLITLAETQVAPALAQLAASGALSALYGLRDTPLVGRLDALKAEAEVPLESYLLALLLSVSEREAEAFVKAFGFSNKLLGARTRLQERLRGKSKQAGAALERAAAPAESALGHVLFGPVAADYPRVRGSDVLSLGLSAGPEVGRVLSLLEQARLDARVASFADELALAKRLVDDIN